MLICEEQRGLLLPFMMAFSSGDNAQTLLFVILKSSLLVALLSHLVSSATVPSRHPDSRNDETNMGVNDVEYHCANDLSWTKDRFFKFRYGDCFGAMYFMLHQENVPTLGPAVSKEFISRRASPSRRHGEPIMTPRKYTIDDCTMAILLRSDIREGDLPGEQGRSTILSDVTSYKAVFAAAGATYDYCGKGLHLPGWAQIGENGGMAVAFWTAGSDMDRRYQSVNNIILPNITLPTETA